MDPDPLHGGESVNVGLPGSDVALTQGGFSSLPDEIIQHILSYIPPMVLLEIESVSRRLQRLANEPQLWRQYCLQGFQFWDARHNIHKKFAAGTSGTDWKSLFTYRAKVDRSTTKSLNGILEKQSDRIAKFRAIAEHGYDVKDTLLRHVHVRDDAVDVLARRQVLSQNSTRSTSINCFYRYYSGAVLGYLHRSMAINEWCKLKDGFPVPIERAIGAYDMFLLRDKSGDIEKISQQLDVIAKRIRSHFAEFSELTPWVKAVKIADFLCINNLTGVNSESSYRDLRNNFLGLALQDPEHPSLPLISVTLFCAVASRLGLDARPCAFPFHVHAVIHLPLDPRRDAADRPPESQEATNLMYLDPFRSSNEVPVSHLRSQLAAIGTPPSNYEGILSDSSTAELVLRCGRNIIESVKLAHENATMQQVLKRTEFDSENDPSEDVDEAFYAALWANCILAPRDSDGPLAAMFQRRRYLPYIMEHLQIHFPSDVALIDRFVVPLLEGLPEIGQLQETIRVMYAADSMPKRVMARRKDNIDICPHVRYRVGQVFRHRRYRYIAVITGWDPECNAGEQWIQNMGVDQLSDGRDQTFYHVLVQDKSTRYVAQENIEIIHPDLPRSLLSMAGRYFKRWDATSSTFISNIRDEYPDD